MDGELKHYVVEKYRGEVVYVYGLPDVVFGRGGRGGRVTVPIDLPRPPGAVLEKALLEVGVATPLEWFSWRIKLNGVPVAREYRPQSTARTRQGFFHKTVYDVTALLNTEESRRKHRVNVTMRYESGEEMIVRHLGLLVFYRSDEARSTVSLLSGALSLDPGESAELSAKYAGGRGALSSIMFSPSMAASITLRVNGRYTRSVSGVVGGFEARIEDIELMDSNRVTIHHEEAELPYHPRELLVSNILLLNVSYRAPRLVVEEAGVEDDVVRLVIRNTGESRPDKALLTILQTGMTIYRQELPLLEPGEETRLMVKPRGMRMDRDIVIRIIWKKLTRTEFTDHRIHPGQGGEEKERGDKEIH